MWINIGAYITEPPVTNNYNRSVAGCPMVNVTFNATTMISYTDVQVSTYTPEDGSDAMWVAHHIFKQLVSLFFDQSEAFNYYF